MCVVVGRRPDMGSKPDVGRFERRSLEFVVAAPVDGRRFTAAASKFVMRKVSAGIAGRAQRPALVRVLLPDACPSRVLTIPPLSLQRPIANATVVTATGWCRHEIHIPISC